MRDLKIYKSSLTDRSEDSLFRYLREIGQVRMISPTEEALLAAKIRNGDRLAEHRLITANLRFVVSCAKKYQKKGLSMPDLVSEGNLGLIKAARLFDETRGFKFISYAVFWIRQSILHALNENARMIRLPMNRQLVLAEINQIAQRLEQLLEREPTLEELSEATGKEAGKLRDSLLSDLRVHYLEDPVSGGENQDNTMMNFLADANPDLTTQWIRGHSLNLDIEVALSRLPEREQRIISLFFGLGTDMPIDDEAIADQIGVSPERIRQLRYAAVGKLRERAENDDLVEYT